MFAQTPTLEPWIVLGHTPLLIYSGPFIGECDSIEDCIQLEPGPVYLFYRKEAEPVPVKYVYEYRSGITVVNGPLEWVQEDGGSRSGNWMRLDSVHNCTNKNYPGHFVCFNIGPGEQHKLYLRPANEEKSTECFTFRGSNWEPVLNGWRPADKADTLLDKLGSKSSKNNSRAIGNHFLPANPHILTPRSSYLQFNVSAPFLARDSLIEYNWVSANAGSTAEWKRTAGFITVPVSGKGREWILGLRKVGQSAVKQYKIQFEPRWFETLVFRVGLIVVVLWFIGSFYLFQRNRRLKKETLLHNRLTDQLVHMQTMMTPHFLVNALVSLKHLVKMRNWAGARQFTEGLSDMLNDELANRSNVYHSLANELEKVQHYIRLQSLTLPINFHLDSGSFIGLYAIEVPVGLLQPVVENAVKYNFTEESIGGSLIIKSVLHKEYAEIIIESFGNRVCENQKPVFQRQKRGMGLEWVKSRLAIHNKLRPQAHISFSTYFEDNAAKICFCFHHPLNA